VQAKPHVLPFALSFSIPKPCDQAPAAGFCPCNLRAARHLREREQPEGLEVTLCCREQPEGFEVTLCRREQPEGFEATLCCREQPEGFEATLCCRE